MDGSDTKSRPGTSGGARTYDDEFGADCSGRDVGLLVDFWYVVKGRAGTESQPGTSDGAIPHGDKFGVWIGVRPHGS